MPRRFLASVLTAGLLVVAGCGALPADWSQHREHEPTAATETPRSATAFPRGFAQNGVETAIARNRTRSLLTESPVTIVARERFRPGAYVDYRFAANATHARFRLHVHNGEADVTRRDTYVDRTGQYVRTDRNGRIDYTTSDATVAETRRRAAGSLWAVLSRMLVLGEYRAAAVRGAGADQRIRYELIDTVLPNATEQRGTLVVDADGTIQAGVLEYRVDGERKRFAYTVEGEQPVNVARPTWLSAVSMGPSRANSTARLSETIA